MTRKVFISHKNTGASNQSGGAIGKKLQELGHKIFFDKFNLEAGDNWNDKIIKELIESDVIIVIVDKETAESHWVQREIDMGRAQGISILPVTLDEFSLVQPAFERFDIKETQAIHFPPAFDIEIVNENIEKIVARVEPLAKKTVENQGKAYEGWKERRKFKPVVKQKARHSTYRLENNPDICEFVIATGDATEIDDFDILVNTENDYMQMARFFEMNTLSALVRWKGAQFSPGNSLKRDTIQQQINEQLRNMGVHELPVGECFVVPTFAGNEGSELRKNGFTYVFHATAVKINRTSREISSLGVDANPEIVKNCFDLAKDIHSNDGAILYDDGKIMASASDNGAVDSILIPVFGAGQGGNPLEEAVSGIIRGFKKYFEGKEQHPLSKVGLCIYNFNDVERVEAIFERNDMMFTKTE